MHLMGWERLERRTRAVPFPAARDAPILCACRVIEPCWKPGHPHEGPLGRLWTPVFPRYLSPGASSSARCQGSCKTPKMLPLLFLWKMSITSLLKSVCSREMFWWFGCFPSERRFCWEITGKVCVVVYDMLLQIAFWNPALYSETGLSW